MLYDMTERLKFDDDPVLKIKDTELTIKSDASTVLQLMAVIQEDGEMEASRKAVDLLFSSKDKKKLDSLNLKMDDFIEVIGVAMSLAVGEDPDEEIPQGE